VGNGNLLTLVNQSFTPNRLSVLVAKTFLRYRGSMDDAFQDFNNGFFLQMGEKRRPS
jgi:hypothetical protein